MGFFLRLEVASATHMGDLVHVFFYKAWSETVKRVVRMPNRATLAAIDRVHGSPLIGTGIEVNEDEVDDDGVWKPPDDPMKHASD
jgi:hypothetical protein